MMGTNEEQWAITPHQAGIIHHYLAINMPDYVDYDFCAITEPDIIINNGEDVIWNSTKFLRSNIVIRNGGQLTIECTVNMPDNATILIERGGKLIVSGGTITSACERWQSIQIIGNNSLSQTETNQGVVELNNAIIESAKKAIGVNWNGCKN